MFRYLINMFRYLINMFRHLINMFRHLINMFRYLINMFRYLINIKYVQSIFMIFLYLHSLTLSSLDLRPVKRGKRS